MSDGVYLSPDGVIPNGLYVCPSQPKGIESRKDMWRKAPYNSDSNL